MSKKNISPRAFALGYFKRNPQHTDNVTLCILICDETGWAFPDENKNISMFIRKFRSEAKKSSANAVCSPPKSRKRTQPIKKREVNFYSSKAWRALRYKALCNSEGRCQCCGAMAADGVQIHVDHIRPRSKYPDLELDLSNLQVLCEDCNIGKDNIDQTNWRDHWDDI